MSGDRNVDPWGYNQFDAGQNEAQSLKGERPQVAVLRMARSGQRTWKADTGQNWSVVTGPAGDWHRTSSRVY